MVEGPPGCGSAGLFRAWICQQPGAEVLTEQAVVADVLNVVCIICICMGGSGVGVLCVSMQGKAVRRV